MRSFFQWLSLDLALNTLPEAGLGVFGTVTKLRAGRSGDQISLYPVYFHIAHNQFFTFFTFIFLTELNVTNLPVQ